MFDVYLDTGITVSHNPETPEGRAEAVQKFLQLLADGSFNLINAGEYDETGTHGRCDCCGAPCDANGCTTNQSHKIAAI